MAQQSDRAQVESFPLYLGVVIGMVIALLVGLQFVGAGLPTQEQLDEEREAFTEYCHTEFGDKADVYRANDAFTAEHNGLHCDHDNGTVHRSQIPEELWQAYVDDEVDADYLTSQLEDPPGLLPLPDLPLWSWALGVGSVVALVGTMVWAATGGVPPP